MNAISATFTSPKQGGTAATGRVIRRFRSMLNTLGQWRLRARTRRHLRELEEHLLSDVGLDRHAARREALKPFWQQ